MYEAVCRVIDYTVVPQNASQILALLISSLRRSVQQKYYLQFQTLVWLLIMISLTGHWLLVFENWEGRRL